MNELNHVHLSEGPWELQYVLDTKSSQSNYLFSQQQYICDTNNIHFEIADEDHFLIPGILRALPG